jgi:hypothetical protein
MNSESPGLGCTFALSLLFALRAAPLPFRSGQAGRYTFCVLFLRLYEGGVFLFGAQLYLLKGAKTQNKEGVPPQLFSVLF